MRIDGKDDVYPAKMNLCQPTNSQYPWLGRSLALPHIHTTVVETWEGEALSEPKAGLQPALPFSALDQSVGHPRAREDAGYR